MQIRPRCGEPGSPYLYKVKPNRKAYLYYAHRISGGKMRRYYIGP